MGRGPVAAGFYKRKDSVPLEQSPQSRVTAQEMALKEQVLIKVKITLINPISRANELVQEKDEQWITRCSEPLIKQTPSMGSCLLLCMWSPISHVRFKCELGVQTVWCCWEGSSLWQEGIKPSVSCAGNVWTCQGTSLAKTPRFVPYKRKWEPLTSPGDCNNVSEPVKVSLKIIKKNNH